MAEVSADIWRGTINPFLDLTDQQALCAAGCLNTDWNTLFIAIGMNVSDLRKCFHARQRSHGAVVVTIDYNSSYHVTGGGQLYYPITQRSWACTEYQKKNGRRFVLLRNRNEIMTIRSFALPKRSPALIWHDLKETPPQKRCRAC